MGNACTLALLTISAITALAGCAVAPDDEPIAAARSDIAGGALDVHDTGVVGVMLSARGSGLRRSCSGSLLAPNLVLTARHCIADTRPSVDCATSRFGPPAAPELISVTSSAEMWRFDTSWVGAAEVSTPPGMPAVCGHDVALIILTAPLDGGATPLVPRLDDEVKPDERYAAIGYGARDDHGDDEGLRRRRDLLHVVCFGDDCGSRQVEDDEWRGDHGICRGDSGGPAVDEEGGVIGVTSRGPAGCEAPIYGGIAAHAAWIRSEAKRAASMGAYAEPSWTQASARRPTGTTGTLPGASTGCSTAPYPAPEDGVWGCALLAALAALAQRRRCRGRVERV